MSYIFYHNKMIICLYFYKLTYYKMSKCETEKKHQIYFHCRNHFNSNGRYHANKNVKHILQGLDIIRFDSFRIREIHLQWLYWIHIRFKGIIYIRYWHSIEMGRLFTCLSRGIYWPFWFNINFPEFLNNLM